MTDTFTAAVIPAKAGIQTIDNTPKQWSNIPDTVWSAARSFYDKLDSGLRRNDGMVNFAYCCTRFKRGLQFCKVQ